jgi:hypothetical protein
VDLQISTQVNIKCQRCLHKWKYKGKNPFFTLCPHCRTTVSVKKNKIKPLQSAVKKNKIKPLQSAQVGGQSQTATTESAIYTSEGENYQHE